MIIRVSSGLLRLGFGCVFLTVIAAPAARAQEIWVAPTYQQDIGGLGVGSGGVWPVTPLGVARLAWAVPNDLETFQNARLVLVPEASATGATLTVYVCRGASGQMARGACTGPFVHPFSSVANELLEIDVSAGIAPQIGTPGHNHLTVVAFTTPSIATDRILGLRFAYDRVLQAGAATLGANTYTGTQTAPSFVGSGAGLTNVAKLGANTFTGTQTAPAFVGSGAGLTNLPFPAGAATLGANTFTGTQTISGGSLELPGLSTTGTITRNGSLFVHSRHNSTFLGSLAGNSVVGGFGNTGVGLQALRDTAFGSLNTAVGHDALRENTGGRNTAVGGSSLVSNEGGSNNTALGASALENSTGHLNTALGFEAGSLLTSGDNNIYIRHGGLAAESSTTRIGSTQTRTFITGIRSVTTGNNNAVPVLIDSAGQLGTVSSSHRYKEDIHDMGAASDRLLRLRPVTFRYSKPFADGGRPVQYGLIAEEVADVFPELVVRDDEGRPETVQYHTLNVLLLNELLRLQKQVEALQEEVAALRRQRD
jgi:hypothetical protein